MTLIALYGKREPRVVVYVPFDRIIEIAPNPQDVWTTVFYDAMSHIETGQIPMPPHVVAERIASCGSDRILWLLPPIPTPNPPIRPMDCIPGRTPGNWMEP